MGAIPLMDIGRAIVYDPPSHIKPGSFIVLKRESYRKGYYPPHLKEYAADKTGLNQCPVRCEGKTGQSYRECLIECAKEVFPERKRSKKKK